MTQQTRSTTQSCIRNPARPGCRWQGVGSASLSALNASDLSCPTEALFYNPDRFVLNDATLTRLWRLVCLPAAARWRRCRRCGLARVSASARLSKHRRRHSRRLKRSFSPRGGRWRTADRTRLRRRPKRGRPDSDGGGGARAHSGVARPTGRGAEDCSRRRPRRSRRARRRSSWVCCCSSTTARARLPPPSISTASSDAGSQAQDTESLFRAARAAQALGRMQDANTLFRAAARSGRSGRRNGVGRAVSRDLQSARSAAVVPAGPQARRRLGAGTLGVARTLANENPPAAAAAAEEALKIDPELADAQLFLAELDLDNTRYDAARERIDRVLEGNASHLDARALLGAIAYVRDDKAAFDAEVGARARHQPDVRRGLSRRRRSGRAQLSLRRGRRADAARGRRSTRRTSARRAISGCT